MVERNKDSDVYARILQRIERDELHKQCRRVARRDAKRVRKSVTQLHDALDRLRAVDSAATQLRHKQQTPRSRDDVARTERMEAQIREIKVLRARLEASIDALGQPSVVRDRNIHKDHDCKPQSYIKEPSDTVDTKAEPLLETYKLDTYVQVKQELIASAATGVDTNPALQLSSEPTATHKSAYAALVSEERPMQPVVMLELEPDDAEPSARAPTCLDDAQRLAHASLEIQSYQFPFLVAKVQTYLAVRTLLDAAETREIAQALEIAACIGATVASRTPSEPALTELLRTIHKFYALAGDHAVLMATANMAKFAASWRPHAHTPDAAEGDDAVIRMDL